LMDREVQIFLRHVVEDPNKAQDHIRRWVVVLRSPYERKR
jgi:hypothetical protein